MPFCPQCGVDNPPSARFCDQCGATLIPVAASSPPPAPPAATGTTMASAGPTVCPQCGTAVIPGEAFCDNCGASLLTGAPAAVRAPVPVPAPPFGGVAPQPVYPSPQSVGAPPVAAPPPAAYQPPPVAAPPPGRTMLAPASLLVVASGARLPLPTAPQAVIGRADAVSHFFPEIDLTPHGALENGVGRRHLQLLVQGGQIYAEDLDSTNGTFVNGSKLAPRSPQLLRSGDELRLGNLVLKVQL